MEKLGQKPAVLYAAHIKQQNEQKMSKILDLQHKGAMMPL